MKSKRRKKLSGETYSIDGRKSVLSSLSEYRADCEKRSLLRPVARIDFLGCGGNVADSREFCSEADFLKELKEELYCGVPLIVVLYKDDNGATISKNFLEELDTLPKGLREDIMPKQDTKRYSARSNER